jgi:hypothetical protein
MSNQMELGQNTTTASSLANHPSWLYYIYIYIYTQHTRKENIFEFLFIKRKLNKIKLENGLEQTTKVLNENMYATQKKTKKKN